LFDLLESLAILKMSISTTVVIGYNAITGLRIRFTDTSYSFFLLINQLIHSFLAIDYVAQRSADIRNSKITRMHEYRLIILSTSQIMRVASYQRASLTVI
jgi:hypothetical protein